MDTGDEVPAVVAAWGVLLLAGAGVVAPLPPSVSSVLAWPGFLASPLVAAALAWYGFDRTRLGTFAVVTFLVGVACWLLFDAGVVRRLLSPAAVTRLRLGVPLFVLVVARFATSRLTAGRE